MGLWWKRATFFFTTGATLEEGKVDGFRLSRELGLNYRVKVVKEGASGVINGV